ncbi:efflux RND transporter permease subunit [Thermodesulfatator autotrophicus]|uniref:Multidrug transporter AcrB n=1 Tax=Thermodesulfatator autotrophicus TaxID=1795632 RepID=A0A177E927_9BACT|nr:efflux RND transporter permease subunit [Thermodesulfatator autotrophicus]OAG28308.1 multidrug transporter AcrB [Thermodesulfatator autotrophicus]
MRKKGFISSITEYFIDSPLTPIVIIATLILGVMAVLNTPSEEEPQIVVPMIDIFVEMPGATAEEIENRVVYPMEKLLWEIPGVEYVYSTAMNGRALTVVRFYVGEDVEDSLVKTYDKLYSHLDWIPPGCSHPLLKPRSIDDVPIVVLTFWGKGYDALTLRQIAKKVEQEVKRIPGISETFIKGGLRREVRVELDPTKVYALGLDPLDVLKTISSQNQARITGTFRENNYQFQVRLNNFISDLKDLENTVVATVAGKPVFLKDVANISLTSEEPENYVFFVPGPAASQKQIKAQTGELYPAVSLAIAKRKGENATKLAEKVLHKVEILKGYVIPHDLNITVTRNYGETAKEKTDELLKHLFIAISSVAILIALFLGFRASLVVMVAVPVTLAITLAIYWLFGYTLNRVTLFALIFCIGILVDDPIVDVENIVRHLRLPENRGKSFRDIIVGAVNEVRAPLILATFTVIAAIAPMGFVRGLMGPYMRPMPVGATAAMLLSMIVAFIITPWTAKKILSKKAHGEEKETLFTRYYRWMMEHLIRSPFWRWSFLLLVGFLFVLSCSLIYFKIVRVKMLPFDNKSEFQVIVDMPEGTALEKTAKVAQSLGQVLEKEPYVTDYQIYVGTSAPFNFNGLVRHYYLRSGDNIADIQVNLLPKHERDLQSHDIAKRVREKLRPVAEKYGATITVAEIPPGPPVLQTLVAEVYGSNYEEQIKLARKVKEIFARTPGVVDVDWYMTEPHTEWRLKVDTVKATLAGISPEKIIEVLETAIKGKVAGLFHDAKASEDIYIKVHFPVSQRSSLPDLESIKIRGENGRLVSLAEIATWEEAIVPNPIYHKNLRPVIYVVGDMAGKEESPIYGIMKINKLLKELKAPNGEEIKIYYTKQPFSEKEWAIKWDGEWHVTYEVFRDMGLAFGVCVLLIYILIVAWFKSYTVPLVLLAPIPLSLIGILPAHALTGSFFTATSMIGFIAGAGIVVRNSIILADFIEMRLKEGLPLEKAVIEAGVVRFRPMLLTAAAVVVGSFVILFDPIFNGLALSLMAGEVASTLFSRMVVPVLYYLEHRIKTEGRLVL